MKIDGKWDEDIPRHSNVTGDDFHIKVAVGPELNEEGVGIFLFKENRASKGGQDYLAARWIETKTGFLRVKIMDKVDITRFTNMYIQTMMDLIGKIEGGKREEISKFAREMRRDGFLIDDNVFELGRKAEVDNSSIYPEIDKKFYGK